jgi:hypothetical protein
VVISLEEAHSPLAAYLKAQLPVPASALARPQHFVASAPQMP